ncbi:MAG: S8 family peptidase [Bacteroidota bacterium]
MHPRYISKSDHPANFLNQIGLRALGSKSAIIKPDSWGVANPPQEAVTTVLFVAGKRGSFDDWSNAFTSWPDSGAARDIMKFESVDPLTSAERIRAIPDASEVQLELVLHSDPSGLIVDAFEAYANATGVSLDLDRSRVVGNLCFMPANAAREQIEQLAEFTFLRVVRGMPQLRPLITPVFRVSTAASHVSIPDGAPQDSETSIAVFDGGIPEGVTLDWVTEYDTTGVGPKDKECTEHGLMVTSAVLFGHLDPRLPIELPYANVDHYRVLGDDAGSQESKLYDVLDRIVEVIESESNSYEFVNISLGPRMEIDDDDVTLWTAQLDEVLGRKNILTTVAVGNDGQLDDALGLNRVQPPSDGVNVLAVGASAYAGPNWSVADYSCVGPGRCPGLVKPDVVGFGGSPPEPFLALSKEDELGATAGTSFAAPSVLRLGVGVKAALGSELSPLAIRALLIHHSDRGDETQKRAGWGRVPDGIADLLTSDRDTVHVVYQGEVPFGIQVRADIPEPQGGYQGMVDIAATFCIASAVDPNHANTYTRSGLEVVFRPHEEVFTEYRDGSHSNHAKPAAFFTQRQMYPPDYVLRSDSHKWEPVLKSKVRKRSQSLKKPCFDIYRFEREEGAAPTDSDVLRYALVVTVRAHRMQDLYDQIVRSYQNVLTPLQPKIELRLRT